ncbi:MAG: SRPBCC family protein [Acidimicrobiia bacterium]|nr:SRPBCC family protein [Acidimicrobiia bacterium]
MARYVVHVRTPLDQAAAFDYMADLRNFEGWDPGVLGVEQVEGTTPVIGAEYDVTVQALPKPMVLRYRIITFDPSHLVVALAESTLLTSLDRITVDTDDEGTTVTYDAELTLSGPLGLADPLLGIAFKRIGDRAAAGLIEALDGERVEWPASK